MNFLVVLMCKNIVTDNGTQFTGNEFKIFCMSQSIDHTATSPNHPRTNGPAERFEDSFKRALRKITAWTQMRGAFRNSYQCTESL